jgi:hypothetical protein
MLHGSQVVMLHDQGYGSCKHLQQLRQLVQEGSQELQLLEQMLGQAPWQRALWHSWGKLGLAQPRCTPALYRLTSEPMTPKYSAFMSHVQMGCASV